MCVCVCVSMRERERERERDAIVTRRGIFMKFDFGILSSKVLRKLKFHEN